MKTYKSKLYHIYDHVRDDLSRNAQEHEPLPDLVMNAYLLLGKDWLITRQAWDTLRYPTPPVMITVANRTETAARVNYTFAPLRGANGTRAEPARALAAQRLEPSLEPTPPAAAPPHLVAPRPLRALSATGGGAAQLASRSTSVRSWWTSCVTRSEPCTLTPKCSRWPRPGRKN